jgi:hypothetical protein
MPVKMNAARSCAVSHQPHKPGCGNNSKQHTNNSFCNYCVLCIAFIIPVKPGIQRDFASGFVSYPELLQSKLTDYNPSCWRPPNA